MALPVVLYDLRSQKGGGVGFWGREERVRPFLFCVCVFVRFLSNNFCT